MRSPTLFVRRQRLELGAIGGRARPHHHERQVGPLRDRADHQVESAQLLDAAEIEHDPRRLGQPEFAPQIDRLAGRGSRRVRDVHQDLGLRHAVALGEQPRDPAADRRDGVGLADAAALHALPAPRRAARERAVGEELVAVVEHRATEPRPRAQRRRQRLEVVRDPQRRARVRRRRERVARPAARAQPQVHAQSRAQDPGAGAAAVDRLAGDDGARRPGRAARAPGHDPADDPGRQRVLVDAHDPHAVAQLLARQVRVQGGDDRDLVARRRQRRRLLLDARVVAERLLQEHRHARHHDRRRRR